MEVDVIIFLVIIFINTVVSVLYWIWFHIYVKETDTGFFMRALVMFLCPVIGPLYFLLGWLWRKIFFHNPVDLVDVIFSKDRESALFRANEDGERNIVPVEDAVTITDKKNARELMLEVLKHDVRNTLVSISAALNSEDSEISHYAASVLQSELGKFRINIQKITKSIDDTESQLRDAEDYDGELRTQSGINFAKLRAEHKKLEDTEDKETANEDEQEMLYAADISPKLEYSEDYQKHNTGAYEQGRLASFGEEKEIITLGQKLSEQMMLAHKLIDDVCVVLSQNVISEMEQEQYLKLLDRIGKLAEKRDVVSPDEMNEISIQSMNAKKYDISREWCEKLTEYYPDSLYSYSCRIKLYFTVGDREHFFAALDEMKKAGVVLDHEMMELVRVFM